MAFLINRLRLIIDIFSGPTLYRMFDKKFYEPKPIEALGENVIFYAKLLGRCGLYTSPITLYVLRSNVEVVLILYFGLLTTSYIIAWNLRGIGRLCNPDYVSFYKTLKNAQKNITNKETKKRLMAYDFDFSAWPIEFSVRRSSQQNSFNGFYITYLPRCIVGYIALKMIYPGSVKILQYAMFSGLLEGRKKLVEKYGAERFKLNSSDGNEVDAIFVDRRSNLDKNQNGNTLVIVCEGNCGFYEVGSIFTPLEAKHSILGWNHPGFGGSTGSPYPEQECNAIDAVMQFALNHLKFPPEQIIVYGWSIGGFTSSWAAKTYPDIKGLVLDATFDDLLPLALSRVPSVLHSLVRIIVRDHINLTVYDHVAKYPGPVTIIRRSDDEMICTVEGDATTNRCNVLVTKFLNNRYPKLIDNSLLKKWLESGHLEQVTLRDELHVDNIICATLIASYIEDNSSSYPMLIGEDLSQDLKQQLTVFLAEQYMKEFSSTHCVPLPVSMFRPPWTPVQATEAGFVKV